MLTLSTSEYLNLFVNVNLKLFNTIVCFALGYGEVSSRSGTWNQQSGMSFYVFHTLTFLTCISHL